MRALWRLISLVKPYTPRYDWPVKDRPNATSKIPYAYMEDPENPLKLIPDPELIPHIERALQYINDGNSIRSVSQWLSQATKKTITHQGMDYIWELKCGSDPHNPIVKERRKRRRERAPKTEEAKEQLRIKKELSKAKAKITREQKKLEAVQAAIAEKERLSQIEPEEIIYHPFDSEPVPVIPPELENREIAFTPNPGPQTEFLAAPEREVLYGGSAGSGKSYAILADPMRYFDNPNFRGLILRRTNDELRELKWKSKELYSKTFPGAKWKEQQSLWVFPSGAELWMTYLERDDDVLRYQGQSFSYIAVDELTQYATPFAWDYLRSRLRTTDVNLPVYMRACVDEGDVLTETGWKPIQEVKVGELVYSNLPNGTTVLRKVHTTAKYEIDEPLVRIRKKNFYASMTKDHRVAWVPNSSKTHKLTRWNEHTGKSIDIVRSGNWNPSTEYKTPVGKWSNVEFASFLGWYIAEGSFCKPRKGNYKVIITQLKAKNHTEISELLGKSYTYCYSANGDFQITNKELHTWVSQFGKAKDKHFPDDFMRYASREQLEKAFYSYMKGDGHWQKSKNGTAFTTSEKLVGQLYEIGFKLGYKVQHKVYYSMNPKHNTRYSIYFTPGYTTKVDKHLRSDVTLEHYKGFVYCIGVEETENFVIRQGENDNKYIWLTGNTTNPGGPGHGWVKKMFVDPQVPGKPFVARDIETGEELRYPDNHHDRKLRGEPLFFRRFIPAKLKDNPYLMKGGEYEANLMSLPEAQRRKLLEGDWSIVEGAAFPEFRTDVHVIEPYKIPSSWRKFRSADFGYSSYSAVHWFAIDPIYETLVVYRELYVSKMTAIDLAQKIKQIEAEAGERVMYGVLDSSTWHQRGHNGPSIAEEMIGQGVSWRPSDRTKGSRTAGFNRLHELFKTTPYSDGKKMPGIVFFNNCRQVIADLQVIPVHPDGLDDIDDKYTSDHTYDSIRYGIMSRPRGQSPWDFEVTSISAYHSPVDRVFGY